MAVDKEAFKHAYQAAADWVSSNPEVHERYPHAPMIEAAIVAYEQTRAKASPDMVERVARAIYRVECGRPCPEKTYVDGNGETKPHWDLYTETAKAAIAAMHEGHMLKNPAKMNMSGEYVQGVSISGNPVTQTE